MSSTSPHTFNALEFLSKLHRELKARQDILATVFEQLYGGMVEYYRKNLPAAQTYFLQIEDELCASVFLKQNASIFNVIICAFNGTSHPEFMNRLLAHIPCSALTTITYLANYFHTINDYDNVIVYCDRYKAIDKTSIAPFITLLKAETLAKLNRQQEALQTVEAIYNLLEPTDMMRQQLCFKVIQYIMIREGYCNSCDGDARTCCNSMALQVNGGYLHTFEDYSTLLQTDPQTITWIPTNKDINGAFHFDCIRLNSDKLCKDYDRRANVCRSFPDTFIQLKSFPKCSYSFKLNPALSFSSVDLLKDLIKLFQEHSRTEDSLFLEKTLVNLYPQSETNFEISNI